MATSIDTISILSLRVLPQKDVAISSLLSLRAFPQKGVAISERSIKLCPLL